MTWPIRSMPGVGVAAAGAGAHDARRRPSVHRAARLRVNMACSLQVDLTRRARYGAGGVAGIRRRAQAVLKTSTQPITRDRAGVLAEGEDLDRVRLSLHVRLAERAQADAVVAQTRSGVAREDRVDRELLGERLHPRR